VNELDGFRFGGRPTVVVEGFGVAEGFGGLGPVVEGFGVFTSTVDAGFGTGWFGVNLGEAGFGVFMGFRKGAFDPEVEGLGVVDGFGVKTVPVPGLGVVAGFGVPTVTVDGFGVK
jgi:hypothetical protein